MNNNNTTSLLKAIANYCKENPDYCFWYEKKSNIYRLYLGEKSTYNKFKDFCEYDFGVINDKFINSNNLTVEYSDLLNSKTFLIMPYHQWDENDIHRYKLFTYCKERVYNKFLYVNYFSTFFESKVKSIDIEKCLQHVKFRNHDDWSFFTKNLTDDNLKKIWSDYSQVMSLANYFNNNFNEVEKKLFLEPLILSPFLKRINKQSLNFLQFLEKIHHSNQIKDYSHYSVVEKSLKNSSYFDDKLSVITEKIVMNPNIYKLKNTSSHSIGECNYIYSLIINQMKINEQLIKCGLLDIDIIHNEDKCNNTFYINKNKYSTFTQEDFKTLFVTILNAYSDTLKNEKMNPLTTTIINKWFLESTLELKQDKTNKIKI